MKIPHCPDFFWTAASCWTSAPLKTPVYRRTAFQGFAPSFVEQAAPRRARHLFTKKVVSFPKENSWVKLQGGNFYHTPFQSGLMPPPRKPLPDIATQSPHCHYRATTSLPFYTKRYLPLPCKAPCHCHAKSPLSLPCKEPLSLPCLTRLFTNLSRNHQQRYIFCKKKAPCNSRGLVCSFNK